MIERFSAWLLSPGFFASIIIIFLAIVLKRLLKNIQKNNKYLEGEKGTYFSVLFEIIKYAIILGAVFLVLQANGVNVGTLFAGVGIVSAIAGLAMQDLLKDVIMGARIMSDKFFNIGDYISIDGVEGKVISFSILTTKIQQAKDGAIISICNRYVDKVSINPNMVDINIPLSYEDDYKYINEKLLNICELIKKVDGVSSCQYKGTEDFDSSSIIYKVRLFVDPSNKFDIRRKALAIIQEELEKANLKIPYNKLDIHNY